MRPQPPPPLADPGTRRLWRLAEDLAANVRRVHLIAERDAPPFTGEAGAHHDVRWDLLGAHQHAVPTAVGCLAGVVRLVTARRRLDLAPGELAVIAPGAWHAVARLRPGSAQWSQGLLFGRSDCLLTDGDREVALLLPRHPSERLLADLIGRGPATARRALAGELVGQCLGGDAVAKAAHPAVWRMGRRLWSRLHRPLAAAEVLAAAGVGQRQALRLFTAWFGAPPKRVIREQQLALAAERLRGGASVAEAAAASGFPDRASLTRAWRLAHGSPPSRTRKRQPPAFGAGG